MLGRAVACAAVLFVWPVCTQISDGDGPLLLSEIIISVDRGQADGAERNAAEPEKPTARPRSADLATPAAAPVTATEANAASASKTLTFGTEPFGLTAEPIVTGEILTKWDGVETQIDAENRVLAHCRNAAPGVRGRHDVFLRS